MPRPEELALGVVCMLGAALLVALTGAVLWLACWVWCRGLERLVAACRWHVLLLAFFYQRNRCTCGRMRGVEWDKGLDRAQEWLRERGRGF